MGKSSLELWKELTPEQQAEVKRWIESGEADELIGKVGDPVRPKSNKPRKRPAVKRKKTSE